MSPDELCLFFSFIFFEESWTALVERMSMAKTIQETGRKPWPYDEVPTITAVLSYLTRGTAYRTINVRRVMIAQPGVGLMPCVQRMVFIPTWLNSTSGLKCFRSRSCHRYSGSGFPARSRFS